MGEAEVASEPQLHPEKHLFCFKAIRIGATLHVEILMTEMIHETGPESRFSLIYHMLFFPSVL